MNLKANTLKYLNGVMDVLGEKQVFTGKQHMSEFVDSKCEKCERIIFECSEAVHFGNVIGAVVVFLLDYTNKNDEDDDDNNGMATVWDGISDGSFSALLVLLFGVSIMVGCFILFKHAQKKSMPSLLKKQTKKTYELVTIDESSDRRSSGSGEASYTNQCSLAVLAQEKELETDENTPCKDEAAKDIL